MICMNYFPMVVKTRHLRELREFLEAKFGMPFDEIFLSQLSGKRFSQFNIMCAFMWYYKHNEYTWYIHDKSPQWDGITPHAGFGQWSERWIFNKTMFAWKPQVSVHVRYRPVWAAVGT